MLTRRQFLRVGLVGAGVLAAAGLLRRGRSVPGGDAFRILDTRSAGVIAALVPAVLAGTLPPEGPERAVAVREVVEAFDRAVSGLSPAVQEEIGQLLGLLGFAPTRIVLAGVSSSWEDASAGEVSAFLSRWRHSRFDLFRASYQALSQLLQAAWYGNPKAWPAIGYPGPPPLGAGTSR